MGLYYRFVNRTKKEVIDIDDTTNRGRKVGAMIKAGPILAFAMQSRWHGDDVQVSNDSADDWYAEDEERGYRNVSREVIDEMRKYLGRSFFDELSLILAALLLALLLTSCALPVVSPPPDAPPPTCLELGVPPSQPLLCTQAGLCTLADGRICTREVTP